MPSNYFSPITYLPRQPVVSAFTQTPVTPLDQGTIDTINNQGAGTFANGAGPNSAARALLATSLGTGPNSFTTQANTQMGVAANATRQALRGYGGVSFGVDDTSTPNVNEGLLVNYTPDKLGSKDRQAVISARAQASARGMGYSGFGDQMVGAALQRVGEEARGIVNQYAQQINQIATTTNTNVQSAITTLGGLYGSDSTWNLQMEANKPPPTPPPSTQPSNDIAPNQDAEYPVTNPAWSWAKSPRQDGPNGLDARFGYGNYIIVRKPDGKYTVKVKG